MQTMSDLQAKSNNNLALCPFCGGEAEMLTAESMNGGYLFGIMCNDCCSRGDVYDTEAEAIAAWNSRAERTCKPIGTIRYDYEGGYAGFEYETELSCGHKWRDAYGDYPDYCPSCGCKVVGE